MNVFVNPYLDETPKIHFDCGIKSEKIDAFNKWLGAEFGTVPPYIIAMGKIFTTQRGYQNLIEAVKEFKK